MKKSIFVSVSVGVLLMAGSAMATVNSATIDQIGMSQNGAIDQTASSSDALATITQSGAYNAANIVQGASGNQASVTQSQGAYSANRIPSNISNSNQQGV